MSETVKWTVVGATRLTVRTVMSDLVGRDVDDAVIPTVFWNVKVAGLEIGYLPVHDAVRDEV